MSDSSSLPESPRRAERPSGRDRGIDAPVRKHAKLQACLFSLLPLVAIFVLAEMVIRATGLDEPKLLTPFAEQEDDPVHRRDPQLFFAMRPNVDVQRDGVRFRTNSHGLRTAEIGDKQPGEFRILSLGESTTFGAFVESEQTYSAQLETKLRSSGYENCRVINAGVSAYSSFQSLRFLELRGLELQPDMVLFYHEINDFLPATVRGGEMLDETALTMTDRELHESKQQSLHRRLLSISAVYRLLHYYQSRRRLNSQDLNADEQQISVKIPDSFYMVNSREGARKMNVRTRVPAEERKVILQELASLCADHGVQLVVIHPSYRDSQRHECELTEFCQSTQVPMFEAYPSLHPPESNPDDWFLDSWHPSVIGHEAIARDLCQFLVAHRLLPAQ